MSVTEGEDPAVIAFTGWELRGLGGPEAVSSCEVIGVAGEGRQEMPPPNPRAGNLKREGKSPPSSRRGKGGKRAAKACSSLHSGQKAQPTVRITAPDKPDHLFNVSPASSKSCWASACSEAVSELEMVTVLLLLIAVESITHSTPM